MRVYVGIPAYHRSIDVEILFGITEILSETELELDTAIVSLIHVARNSLVERFLKSDAGWLYFWDADTVIRDSKLFLKLIETSERFDAGIVGAAYRWKDASGRLVAGNLENGKILNFTEKDVTEPRLADAVGTGTMLIRRDVLEAMPAPWFEFVDTPEFTWSEDYNFCLKAKKLGFKTALDTRIATRHYGLQFWGHTPT